MASILCRNVTCKEHMLSEEYRESDHKASSKQNRRPLKGLVQVSNHSINSKGHGQSRSQTRSRLLRLSHRDRELPACSYQQPSGMICQGADTIILALMSFNILVPYPMYCSCSSMPLTPKTRAGVVSTRVPAVRVASR